MNARATAFTLAACTTPAGSDWDARRSAPIRTSARGSDPQAPQPARALPGAHLSGNGGAMPHARRASRKPAIVIALAAIAFASASLRRLGSSAASASIVTPWVASIPALAKIQPRDRWRQSIAASTRWRAPRTRANTRTPVSIWPCGARSPSSAPGATSSAEPNSTRTAARGAQSLPRSRFTPPLGRAGSRQLLARSAAREQRPLAGSAAHERQRAAPLPRRSASLDARAMMLRAGLAEPWVGQTLPSAM